MDRDKYTKLHGRKQNKHQSDTYFLSCLLSSYSENQPADRAALQYEHIHAHHLHVGEKLSLAEEELVEHHLVASPGLKSSSPRISSCRGAADHTLRLAMSVVGAWTIAHASLLVQGQPTYR